MVDQCGNFALDTVELCPVEQPGLADPAAEMLEAIAVFPQTAHFVLGAIELRIARVMAVEAAGVDLDCARPAARPGALDRLARRLMHLEEIVAVDLDCGQSETGGAPRDVAAADGILERGAFAVLVVLEHKDRRQFQHHGHVHRLEGGALVRATVAGERHRNGVAAEGLGSERRADGERRAAADDTVGAEHAAVEIGDVHRSAFAAAQPGLPREQLLHHQGRVAALGDAVAVPAMGAGDLILRPQMHADADRRRLLAGVEMDKARYAAFRELVLHAFLELADRRHVTIGFEQFLAAQLHGVLPLLQLRADTACFAAASQLRLHRGSVVRDFGACPWRQRAPDGGLHLRRLGRQRIAHSAQMATQFVDLIEEAEDQRQRLFVDRELLADVEDQLHPGDVDLVEDPSLVPRILPGRELVTQRGNLAPVPPSAARSDAVAGSTLWPHALHPAKPSGSPKARRGHTAAGLGVEARRQALPTKNSSPS
jgi:hypothetical protein